MTAPAPGKVWLLGFVVVALAPIWVYLGGPPLTGKSDGRYAAVSRDMADHDHWLAPRLGEALHLTKPPLTYWAEAACIRMLGASEFAVRVPSAVAGSLLIVAVWGMGWHLGGRRVGLLAAGVLAIMPMHVIVSRLTLTDGLLQLWWFLTLLGSFLAVRQPGRWRWPVILWAAIAMGWLTKGPIALLPLLIVIAWLVLGGRWRELKHLRLWGGFPLSLVPVGLWFAAVVTRMPEAWQKIRAELTTQAGGGVHDEPIVYFLGVFLVAMFPATAMLNIPPINYSFKAAWKSLREGRDVCLWALAIVLPLVIFSLAPSKLATYIAPVAAPLAILTALMLEGWLNGSHDRPPKGYRPPEVRWALAVASLLLAAACFYGVFKRPDIPGLTYPWPLVALVIATLYLVYHWRRGAARRRTPMIVIWLALAVTCVWFAWTATRANPWTHPDSLLRHAAALSPADQSHIVTYEYTDYALSFYHGQYVPRYNDPDVLLELAEQYPRSLVIFADTDDLPELVKRRPEFQRRFFAGYAGPTLTGARGPTILIPALTDPNPPLPHSGPPASIPVPPN